jgi:hypothetical protein
VQSSAAARSPGGLGFDRIYQLAVSRGVLQFREKIVALALQFPISYTAGWATARIAVLVVCLSTGALAEVKETQHAFEFVFRPTSKLEVTAHQRTRTQPTGLGVSQIRGGGIAEYFVNPRFSFHTGYYRQFQATDHDWSSRTHRIFAGAAGRLARWERAQLEGRSSVERWINSRDPAFTRFRNRLRIGTNGKTGPYATAELFIDSHGWRSVRYGGGLRWRASESVDLDMGYFYESRRIELGQARHVWQTAIRFRNVSRMFRGG